MKSLILVICTFPLWLHAQQMERINTYAGVNTRLIDRFPLEFSAKVVFPSGFGLAGYYSWYPDVKRYNPQVVVYGNGQNNLSGSMNIRASAHCFRIGGLYALKHTDTRLFTAGINFINSFIENKTTVEMNDPYWGEYMPVYKGKKRESVQAMEFELDLAYLVFSKVYLHGGMATGFAFKQAYKIPIPDGIMNEADADRTPFIPGLGFGTVYVNFSVGAMVKIGSAKTIE